MDWSGLSYSTLTAQSEFEVRFFDRGPIAYSQVIPLFAGTMRAPLGIEIKTHTDNRTDALYASKSREFAKTVGLAVSRLAEPPTSV